MRNTLVALLLGISVTSSPSAAFAQQTTPAPDQKSQTKLEAFLSNKGTLLVKDFYELGKLGGMGSTMSLDAVVLTQPGNESQRVRGLRIEITESGRLERSNTSFLDLEEIESLSKALAYMSEVAQKWKPIEKQEYTEVQFATKGDFRIGFYQRKKNQGAFASSGTVGVARLFLEVDDFAKARTLVDQGLSLLQSK